MMEDKMIKAISIVTTRKLQFCDSMMKKYGGREIPYSRLGKLKDCIANLDYSLFLTDKEKQEKTIFTKTDLREVLKDNPEIQDILNKEMFQD